MISVATIAKTPSLKPKTRRKKQQMKMSWTMIKKDRIILKYSQRKADFDNQVTIEL